MITLFLIAGIFTSLLLVTAVGFLILFLLLKIINAPKIVSYLTLLPVLCGIGGVVCSWGTAYFAEQYSGFSSLPLWAWLIGLIFGCLGGLAVGFFVVMKFYKSSIVK